MKRILVAAVAGSALALTACGGGATSESTVTETVSTSAYDSDEYETADSDALAEETDSISDAALQITWDGMTTTEQDEICDGWNSFPEISLNAFMEGADGTFTRSQVRAFFDGEC